MFGIIYVNILCYIWGKQFLVNSPLLIELLKFLDGLNISVKQIDIDEIRSDPELNYLTEFFPEWVTEPIYDIMDAYDSNNDDHILIFKLLYRQPFFKRTFKKSSQKRRVYRRYWSKAL